MSIHQRPLVRTVRAYPNQGETLFGVFRVHPDSGESRYSLSFYLPSDHLGCFHWETRGSLIMKGWIHQAQARAMSWKGVKHFKDSKYSNYKRNLMTWLKLFNSNHESNVTSSHYSIFASTSMIGTSLSSSRPRSLNTPNHYMVDTEISLAGPGP